MDRGEALVGTLSMTSLDGAYWYNDVMEEKDQREVMLGTLLMTSGRYLVSSSVTEPIILRDAAM